MNYIEAWDPKANQPENILEAIQAIGRSVPRRLVFEAIYYHKKRIKTVAEIVEIAKAEGNKLTRMQVLQSGGHLYGRGIIGQTKKNGDTAYSQVRFYQTHKKAILSGLDDRTKANKLPNKRRSTVSVNVRTIHTGDRKAAKAIHITVDDIDSFSKVQKVRSRATSLPKTMSEKQFKLGVQSIIGETGTFRDWGGESDDLYSTRLIINGKRRRASFGFKGPGLKSALVPSKLGVNGDQMIRLFKQPAEVFIVQHWREIKSSVYELMELHAEKKARTTGKTIWYALIDGNDSNRLRLAYLGKFRRKKAA